MKQFKVTAESLNIREEPKLTGKILGALHTDEIVEWISTSGDNYWHKIRRLDGLIGWSSHKYLVSLENEEDIQEEEFPWMPVAMREIGIYEYEGAADNPRVVEYLSSTNLGITERSNDETPWCSAFANWCVENAGHAGTDSAWARSWLNWGQAPEKPRRGCVVVLAREGGGHVGFYMGETSTDIKVLGGNQSDKVCIANYPKSRLLGYRIPL
jgi:uncharacterized protein (TIGR02594 family)